MFVRYLSKNKKAAAICLFGAFSWFGNSLSAPLLLATVLFRCGIYSGYIPSVLACRDLLLMRVDLLNRFWAEEL